MPARPSPGKGRGVAVVGDAIVGRDYKALRRIDDAGHSLERDEIVPLIGWIRGGAVTSLGFVPQRNPAGRLVADVPIGVGEHN